MAKVKQYLEIISAECDECGGAGFVFWGDENNYDVETCDCVADVADELKDIIAIPCDECGGAGFIFWGNENNYDVEACDCALDEWGI